MGTEKYFEVKLHNSTYRKYLHRMNDNKVQCMKIAKQYEKNIGMETEDMDMADTNISKGDGSL